jgi:uncharacterized protein (DUF1697 family)
MRGGESVVLLRGVNVGGHRTFRPKALASRLEHLDVVNIGAAGTFVVRGRASLGRVRAEFARELPFETEIVVCTLREIEGLVARDHFATHRARRDLVPFVSVLARAVDHGVSAPQQFPPGNRWVLRILAIEGRFVVGIYRRQMEAIRELGKLDRLFGVPVTTRNWNTFTAIVAAGAGGADRRGV